MGLIADKVIEKMIAEKMEEIFGAENIASPEHEPLVFGHQVKLAKWVFDMGNKPTEIVEKSELESQG
jgi:hypothetical protein